jgi:NhaP-type Na+/H+ or K+/H+ antiporter
MDTPTKEYTFETSMIIILAMITLYMLFEGIKHENSIVFGHAASFTTLVGLAISGFEFISESTQLLSFRQEMFFYAVLPPIVFASGFNMYRSKFFQNINNVVLFGVVSTFVCFSLFSAVVIWYASNHTMTQSVWDPESQSW